MSAPNAPTSGNVAFTIADLQNISAADFSWDQQYLAVAGDSMTAPCTTGCDGTLTLVSSIGESLYVVGVDSTAGRLTATKFLVPPRWEQL